MSVCCSWFVANHSSTIGILWLPITPSWWKTAFISGWLLPQHICRDVSNSETWSGDTHAQTWGLASTLLDPFRGIWLIDVASLSLAHPSSIFVERNRVEWLVLCLLPSVRTWSDEQQREIIYSWADKSNSAGSHDISSRSWTSRPFSNKQLAATKYTNAYKCNNQNRSKWSKWEPYKCNNQNPPAPKVLGRDLPDGTRKRLQVYLGGGVIFRPKPPVFDRSSRAP